MTRVSDIDAILPQTQCTKCGYENCLAYAKKIAEGVPHNQCPPGGVKTIRQLSLLLNRPVLPLNVTHGIEKPKQVAKIQEADCIGCTKCIDACPVDAIMGSGKMMHTVLTDECTGCDLCVEPCPVDCIDLVARKSSEQPEALSTQQYAALQDHYRSRHKAKNARLLKQQSDKIRHYTAAKMASTSSTKTAIKARQQYIRDAILRVNQKQRLKTYD